MSTQCHTPFSSCPTLISTGWSCRGTNFSYPFGLEGGHYSLYLDDERFYEEWDKRFEKEQMEDDEYESFDMNIVQKKQFHIPDMNTPRISERGPIKKILKEVKIQKQRKATYKKKISKSFLDHNNEDNDDWLLLYMEELEYWEYNHQTEEVIITQ